MDAVIFEDIYSKFKSIVDECESHLHNLTTKDNALELTLKEFISLTEFCKKEQVR